MRTTTKMTKKHKIESTRPKSIIKVVTKLVIIVLSFEPNEIPLELLVEELHRNYILKLKVES